MVISPKNYHQQVIRKADYEAQDFSKIPVTPVTDETGKWVIVSIDLPGRTLYARVWRVDVGRIELYLLDTDLKTTAKTTVQSLTTYMVATGKTV